MLLRDVTLVLISVLVALGIIMSAGAGCPTHSRFSNVWDHTCEQHPSLNLPTELSILSR